MLTLEGRRRSWIESRRLPKRDEVSIATGTNISHSNLTQWKRAGLITLKSLDRNQELLFFFLFAESGDQSLVLFEF